MPMIEDVESALRDMRVLYSRNISDRVEVKVCQIDVPSEGRAQFLNIVILDKSTGRCISLRLSTFRKIIKFLGARDLIKARHLNTVEKVILRRQEGWPCLSVLGWHWMGWSITQGVNVKSILYYLGMREKHISVYVLLDRTFPNSPAVKVQALFTGHLENEKPVLDIDLVAVAHRFYRTDGTEKLQGPEEPDFLFDITREEWLQALAKLNNGEFEIEEEHPLEWY